MNLSFLFKYLKVQKINIDQKEFVFQLKSNPYFPSLLAISDTLSFFGISNGVIHIEVSELSSLPNCFLALLKVEGNESSLFYVEKIDNKYFYTNSDKMLPLSLNEFEIRWEGVVMLVDSYEDYKISVNERYPYVLFSILMMIFLFFLFLSDDKLYAKIFYIFPILGIVFSFLALKDIFGVRSKLINDFCNINSFTNCNSIIESKKWRIFEVLNFGDLSIFFFISQFLCLLILNISNSIDTFFQIQKFLLFASIPFLLLSLYYQKFVERKWCPICLGIVVIIASELIYLLIYAKNNVGISYYQIIITCFISILTIIVIMFLKRIFLQLKELKEYQIKAMRFERNYQIFKNTLVSRTKYLFPEIPIVLGNRDALTNITIITNPFCGYCKKVHELIDSVLDSEQDNVQIKLIIKADFKNENEDSIKLYRSLYNIYLERGEVSFRDSLKNWFNSKDISLWLVKYESFDVMNQLKINSIYDKHNIWCRDNNLNYTPAIFINGYEYPEQFERDNLLFFVKEVIDDSSLN